MNVWRAADEAWWAWSDHVDQCAICQTDAPCPVGDLFGQAWFDADQAADRAEAQGEYPEDCVQADGPRDDHDGDWRPGKADLL